MGASQQIDDYIDEIKDWRGDLLKQLRKLIHEADPDIQEEWKWMVPVFTHNGLVCAISAFKDHVKLNFFNGAKLKNQSLFNSGLDSKGHRSINFGADQIGDKAALKAAVKEAVKLNLQ